jgi:phosphoglycerol transferase MdoB-like AlkP superfamily enzyme
MCFLLVYALPGLDPPEVWEAIRTAWRLDLASAAILLLPVVILSLIPTFRSKSPRLTKTWTLASVFLFLAVVLISLSDFVFYRERNKHLEEEFFMYWNRDILPALGGAFEAHGLMLSLALIFAVAFSFLIYRKLLGFLVSSRRGFSSFRLNALAFFLTALALFLLIRGLERRPLRSGRVLKSDNPMVNQVAVNPIYNIFVDGLKGYLDQGNHLFYEDSKALATTQKLLRLEGEDFPDDRYPLVRTSPRKRKKDLKNVIIIQQEGFSNGFIGLERGGLPVTPFINDLVKRSLYFPYFIQNVRFTHRALFAINSSYIDRATGRSILQTTEMRNRYSSLPRILAKKGYDLLYFEGGNSSYENMRGFLKMQGYSIFDRLVMEKEGRYEHFEDHRNAFGFYDEFVFEEAAYRLENARKPFLGYIATHSTHSPWKPPGHYSSRFESPYSAIEYADWALKNLFDRLEEQGLLEETIVVITADHTSLPVRDLSHFDLMNIPLIIHALDIKPRIKETVGSQVDILPTVLGLLGIDVPYASMGRDLIRAPKNSGFACSVYNGYAFWWEKNLVIKDWLGDDYPTKLFRRAGEKLYMANVAGRYPGKVKKLQRRLRSYYQTGRTLSLEDRILPRDLD